MSGAGGLGDVLIVIPCLNEAAHLPGLLEAMVRDADGARIVVADGGSTDASRRIVEDVAARHANVTLMDNPARRQAAGVNAAAAAHGAGRRWLVRVDAHCTYPDGYVAGLLRAAAATGADAVVVPMRSVGRGCFQRAAAAAQNSRLGTGGSAHRHVGAGRFVDHGHHALFDLARFRRLGGYDENFSHNEDAEFDHRQALDGARLWLEPALALDYFPRAAPGPLFRQYLNYGRGRARTIAKHGMRPKLRQALPLGVAPAVGLLALAPWVPLAALPAATWALAALAYGAAIGVRQRGICAAASGIAAMIAHLGWSLGFWHERLSGGARSDRGTTTKIAD